MQQKRSVLGLVQLDLLTFIRKMSLEKKRVDMAEVREYGTTVCGIVNPIQVDITVKRLAEKELVNLHPMNQVSYANTLRNEKIIEENLLVCDRAIQHSK